MKIEFTSERRDRPFGDGWVRDVKVGDQGYQVCVSRGRKVRIPYKPRGQNVGFWWNGSVFIEGGSRIWCGPVNKTTGVKGLLIAAGVIPKVQA